MILSLSWRNIWRNKTRSLIVVATLAVGLLGGVMFMGLINGWVEQRMHDSIHNEIAHIQIHNPQYLLNEETQHYISDYPSIITTLDTMKSVVGYTGRIKVFAMAQSDRATSGIVVMGINPTEEATVSEISTKIVAGEFLENNHRVPSIVVGSTTAESLKLINYNLTVEKLDSIDESIIPVEVKDSLKQLLGQRFRSKVSFQKELKNILADNYDSHVDYILKYFAEYRLNSSVILTLQTPEGELHNQMFKVRGVYKTTNSAFDGRFAYVERGVLASTAGLQENQVHEVAVLCTGLDEGKTAAASLAPNFKLLSVRSWEQVSPEIAMYAEMGNFMGMIYIVIILFALAFGIVNTMMMSVLERIRELGML
ncbi:MAG TPA: hypothetical protein PKW61_02710, partial [Tenuifilaceae bacterium]|nr:hypothetical protein [Tenuifilaceae bacterium]